MDNPLPQSITKPLDYDPFGMITFGRSWEVGSEYRYGFNGMEGDDEISGNDNALDFGARVYDTRLGKFLSIDPVFSKFPEKTPYLFASNSPISAIDLNGDSTVYVNTSGVILLVTMDRQPNAVVVVENVKKFTMAVNRAISADEGIAAIDGDITSAVLRRFGTNYRTDLIFAFDKKYQTVYGEACTYLKETTGSTGTSYDSDIREFFPDEWDEAISISESSICTNKKQQYKHSPRFHIHPTHQDGLIPGPSGVNYGGFGVDQELHNGNKGQKTYNIVVDHENSTTTTERSIYFYNYDGEVYSDYWKIDQDVYSSQKTKSAAARIEEFNSKTKTK